MTDNDRQPWGAVRGRLALGQLAPGQSFFSRLAGPADSTYCGRMVLRFLLYISAATDMEAERDILARSVIDIPADVTWRIEQSPKGNEPIDPSAIAQADTHRPILAQPN